MKKIASRLTVAIVAMMLLTQCSSPPIAVTPPARPVLLAIFAHPDDESTVSMVLAKYAAEGFPVYLAVATDGRLGVSEHAGIPAGDTLAAARVQEMNCTTEKLGINPPIMFGLHDQLKMGEGLQPHMDQLREMRDRRDHQHDRQSQTPGERPIRKLAERNPAQRVGHEQHDERSHGGSPSRA